MQAERLLLEFADAALRRSQSALSFVLGLQGTRIGFVPMLADMFGYQVIEPPPSASMPAR